MRVNRHEASWDSPPTASTPARSPIPRTGAIITPIFQTSTYVQEGIGQHKGYEYARTQNPTRRALEKNLAALEGGTDAYCYASGMAATTPCSRWSRPGSGWWCPTTSTAARTGCSRRCWRSYGVEFAFLDASDAARLRRARRATSHMLWIETPTNPLMKVCDIARPGRGRPPAAGAAGRGQHLPEPVLPAPAGPGRGHRRALHHEVPERALRQRGRRGGGEGRGARASGCSSTRTRRAPSSRPSTPGSCCAARRPWPCACRATRRTGAQVAEFLRGQAKVRKVYWPGFPDHPGHDVHQRQASGLRRA